VLLFGVYVADGELVQRQGAEIVQIAAGTPAHEAGLREGDVVLTIDGEPIGDPADLGRIIQSNEPADVLAFGVLRDGEQIIVPVGLGANTDADSPLFGKPYVGVASNGFYETIEHGVPAAAANAVTDIFPITWEMAKGAVKVLNPVNIVSHVAGTNDDITDPIG